MNYLRYIWLVGCLVGCLVGLVSCLVGWLVEFCSISTFVGHLMPSSFSYK